MYAGSYIVIIIINGWPLIGLGTELPSMAVLGISELILPVVVLPQGFYNGYQVCGIKAAVPFYSNPIKSFR